MRTFKLFPNRASLVIAVLAILAIYSSAGLKARENGINGHAMFGCGGPDGLCHAYDTNTTVTIATTATTFYPNQSYPFTLTVHNSAKVHAGCDIAAFGGTLLPGTGLKLMDTELTHSRPKTMKNGDAVFTFTYKTPADSGDYTIVASGNATLGDDNNGSAYNTAMPFDVTVVGPAAAVTSHASNNLSFQATSTIVRDRIGLRIKSDRQIDGELEVVGTSGNVYLRQPQQVEAGTQLVSVPAPALPNGTYIVRLNSGGATLGMGKIIVAR